MQADCPGMSFTKEDCGLLQSKPTPHTLLDARQGSSCLMVSVQNQEKWGGADCDQDFSPTPAVKSKL